MRTLLFFLIGCFNYLFASAQQNIGIGTSTPSASAILDVTSSTKGFLLPRLTSVQKLAINNPSKGLLVYDITSNSLWQYNGAAWLEVSQGGSGWSLSGNAGTNSTHFIGTTDAQSLVFKMNNVQSGLIEVDENKAYTAFGKAALNPNSTGLDNSAFGFKALSANTTGNFNTAIGSGALQINNS